MKILMIFSELKDLQRACSYERKHDSLSAVSTPYLIFRVT